MSSRWLAAVVIACAFDVGVVCIDAAGKTPSAASAPRTETAGHLIVTSISVTEGTVRVRLPDDISAGDTITGTVVEEPAGGSDAQRAANETVLNGYVVDTGASKAPVGRRVITFIVPATATSAGLLLRRSNGGVAGRAAVPVHAPRTPIARQVLPSDFTFPQIAAAGQTFAIAGPFSGDAARSALAIGGRPAEIIAESPRTLVAVPPPNIAGSTNMQLTENGVVATAPCNVISLNLSAPSTRLAKGERTALQVAIGGLAGIRQPVSVRLVNATPGVVSLAGGQTQVLTIQPADVRADGTYVMGRGLTGLGPGSFSLNATLDDQHPLLADGLPTAQPGSTAAPAASGASAPGAQSGRTVSRDKPTPTPKPTPLATPTAAPTATPPPCKWKPASIDTTPYGVDVKDDKKLKALQKAAAALVSKLAPAAANVVAALPAVFGQVSKNLVEVYITYICVDPAGNVVATKVVHLSDIEALDWSAPDAHSFNSGDRKAERAKDIARNTPH